MTDEPQNGEEEIEEESDEYPAAVTDPVDLPMVEPGPEGDGDDQDAQELPPLDDDPEAEG